MTDTELQELIADYLGGDASDADVRRLDELIRTDPRARRELLLAGAMDARLRQVLAGTAPGAAAEQPPAGRGRKAMRSWPWRWAAVLRYAAMLLVALGGWGATVLLAERGWHTRQQLDETNHKLADLQLAMVGTGQSAYVVRAGEPEIVNTRGTVLFLPEDEGNGKSVRVWAGTAIPQGRTVWTCPWGGMGTKYPDGTFVSLDRSTVASFREANHVRQVTLKSGMLSVTHRPAGPEVARMVLDVPQGSVTFDSADVSLAVLGERTIVEAAGGSDVEFRRASDGKTVKIGVGQYAVIEPANELTAVKGALAWKVEPMARNAGKAPVE